MAAVSNGITARTARQYQLQVIAEIVSADEGTNPAKQI